MSENSAPSSESPQEQPKSFHRWKKPALFGSLGLLTMAIAVVGFQVANDGKVAFNTTLNGNDISFQDAETVQDDYRTDLESFENETISLLFRGEPHLITLEELGVIFDHDASVDQIPVLRTNALPWRFEEGFWGEKTIQAQFTWNETEFETLVQERILDLNVPVQEPQIVWSDTEADFTVLEEQIGWSSDLEQLKIDLQDHLARLDATAIEIVTTEHLPEYTAAQIEAQKADLIAQLDRTTTLSGLGYDWAVNWLERTDLIAFEAAASSPTVDSLTIRLNPDAMAQYVTETLAPTLETQPESVTVLIDEEGAISFDGTASDGLVIETDTLIELIEVAFDQHLENVEIPLAITLGEVNIPQELQEQGITELVGVGYSRYWGSPYNRQHNIRTSIKLYDGLIIEAGETFSFGETLGVVNGATGYLPELVIKPEGTIPEYGGGICQVSSTLFRAVLDAGLWVDERHPHSYAVDYYFEPDGPGLDATVYPPAVDFLFTNDMENPILVQAYVQGTEAYFKFYGTQDGRQVEMDGPYITNRTSALATQYTVTETLAPGEIQQVGSAHNGFTATWYRTVTYADGSIFEETILSPYRATATKYLVGAGTEGYGDEGDASGEGGQDGTESEGATATQTEDPSTTEITTPTDLTAQAEGNQG